MYCIGWTDYTLCLVQILHQINLAVFGYIIFGVSKPYKNLNATNKIIYFKDYFVTVYFVTPIVEYVFFL